MKVISGILKGRNIKGYDIEGTRPTMDRVKESIFSTIQNEIKDSIVLDLFCGSGNLGIEAISNGCKLCYFIDNNPNLPIILLFNIISRYTFTSAQEGFLPCFKVIFSMWQYSDIFSITPFNS